MDEKIFALTPMYEGQQCTVQIGDKIYKRVARFNCRDGLYIVINNYKYFEYEMDYSIYFKNKNKGAD